MNQHGQVTAVAPGEVTITAASEAMPELTASIVLADVQQAKRIAFAEKTYRVVLGESLQVGVDFTPADTTDQSLTYRSSHPKSVAVDENGVVTALAAGKSTITATTADGTRHRATTVVEVIVPVTGVHFSQADIRVGANYHGTFTAEIEPKEASNKNMVWSSSDESIATVSGSTNRVRVSGRQWGRCVITGVTEDGGYSCSVNVNIGSLRRAVVVRHISIRDGRPSIVLRNNSDMNITRVSFILTGTDADGNPITMSSRDGETLYGDYELPLAPGESTRHGQFNFYHHTNYPNMTSVSIAITGWETDTGYYGHDDALYYDYTISSDNLDWAGSDD